ncbi:MAG TPA: CPBP family intramembrane glutamic endopeptidase [Gemmataceae bacterium]|jgi:membrane protease YdiL (CAAX protease family)|nr:CPBP family intramembrane glutamic endopeptidase [Gemmataceae bacterium]
MALGAKGTLFTGARATACLLWAASIVVLFLLDRQTSFFALAVAAYAIFLIGMGAWLLPEAVPVETDDVLRAVGTGGFLAARCVVVVVTAGLVYALGAALAGFENGVAVPLLTPLVRELGDIRLWRGVGGIELFKLGLYVLVPAGLLLALGARPRELGLCLPAPCTAVGTVACLVPTVSFVGWGIGSGKLTGAAPIFLLVHNLLSNGFSEEFLCRGMIMSHLRAFVTAEWAVLIQAVIFAIMHFQLTGVEERAAPWQSLAEDIALNMPIGLAFGYLALRSRSLLLPTLLHMFRWVPET